LDGITVGCGEGITVGATDGMIVGGNDGMTEGRTDCVGCDVDVGVTDGMTDPDGAAEGAAVHCPQNLTQTVLPLTLELSSNLPPG